MSCETRVSREEFLEYIKSQLVRQSQGRTLADVFEESELLYCNCEYENCRGWRFVPKHVLEFWIEHDLQYYEMEYGVDLA